MCELQWYVLDPIDLLLMREAKPFSPGDGSWAKGQFPPLPITVFQAMRSATEWIGNQDNRHTKRNLEFMGPFLLYAPPNQEPTLWLPTPQDLVCVMSRSRSLDQSVDHDIEEDDFIETATHWERTARLQPLDQNNAAWKYLELDPDFFPTDQLAPMVPPSQLTEEEGGCDRNTYLHKSKDDFYEVITGRPEPWIRADSLIAYLNGNVLKNPGHDCHTQSNAKQPEGHFHANPWTTQVLPHIKVQPGTRQVADEEGYFTEVAIRMEPHWQLVAGISATLDAKVVRLGGEGHRAIVTPMRGTPPKWDELEKFQQVSNNKAQIAYVLTPGLAEAKTDEQVFGLIPETWKPHLRSCVGDKSLLWGGMSVFQNPKKPKQKKDIAFQPQRAFVPPGTVYIFRSKPKQQLLLPTYPPTQEPNWLKTFKSLNYGNLLWGSP